MKKILITLVLVVVNTAPAFATIKTVKLTVPSMSCAACPITVKNALNNVDGVTKAEVSYARREVVVTFDDVKTNVITLTRATTEAGYPSAIAEGGE